MIPRAGTRIPSLVSGFLVVVFLQPSISDADCSRGGAPCVLGREEDAETSLVQIKKTVKLGNDRLETVDAALVQEGTELLKSMEVPGQMLSPQLSAEADWALSQSEQAETQAFAEFMAGRTVPAGAAPGNAALASTGAKPEKWHFHWAKDKIWAPLEAEVKAAEDKASGKTAVRQAGGAMPAAPVLQPTTQDDAADFSGVPRPWWLTDKDAAAMEQYSLTGVADADQNGDGTVSDEEAAEKSFYDAKVAAGEAALKGWEAKLVGEKLAYKKWEVKKSRDMQQYQERQAFKKAQEAQMGMMSSSPLGGKPVVNAAGSPPAQDGLSLYSMDGMFR